MKGLLRLPAVVAVVGVLAVSNVTLLFAACTLENSKCYKVVTCDAGELNKCFQAEGTMTWRKVVSINTKYKCFGNPEAQAADKCAVDDATKTNLCGIWIVFTSEADCKASTNGQSANILTPMLCAGSTPCP